MSITVTPIAPQRLAVSGDFEAELRVPFEAGDTSCDGSRSRPL